MPLENESDIGAVTESGSVCIHCANADGTVKSCEEIFAGGIQFFLSAIPGADQSLAERIVRKNMSLLPYWNDKHSACLEGESASDEEFAAAMSALSSQS